MRLEVDGDEIYGTKKRGAVYLNVTENQNHKIHLSEATSNIIS